MSLTRQMPWFKFFHGAIHKPRIATLSAPAFRLWVELLCTAADRDAGGGIGMSYDDAAFILRYVRDDLIKWCRELSDKRLVSTNARGIVGIPDWEEKQASCANSAERMARKRNRDRVAKQRLESENRHVSDRQKEAEAEAEGKPTTRREPTPIYEHGVVGSAPADSGDHDIED